MTHDELLAKIEDMYEFAGMNGATTSVYPAIRAVVELHKPNENNCCTGCPYDFEYDKYSYPYPCPTIQAIEKELK